MSIAEKKVNSVALTKLDKGVKEENISLPRVEDILAHWGKAEYSLKWMRTRVFGGLS